MIPYLTARVRGDHVTRVSHGESGRSQRNVNGIRLTGWSFSSKSGGDEKGKRSDKNRNVLV